MCLSVASCWTTKIYISTAILIREQCVLQSPKDTASVIQRLLDLQPEVVLHSQQDLAAILMAMKKTKQIALAMTLSAQQEIPD